MEENPHHETDVMVSGKNKVQAGGFQGKRILVAANSVDSTAFTLDIAANVALMTGSRLEALFVEDIALLRLAELPFAAELSSTSGSRRKFTRPEMVISLQEQANLLRRAMLNIVEKKDLQSKFRVARGDYITEAFSAKSDVLFLTPSKQMFRAVFQSGTTTVSLQNFGPRNLPVYVYLQSGKATRTAVLMANKLGQMLHSDLVFLVSENKMELVAETKNLLEDIVDGMPRVRFELSNLDSVQAAFGAAKKGCAIFVSSRSVFMDQYDRRNVPSNLRCPMMLVA